MERIAVRKAVIGSARPIVESRFWDLGYSADLAYLWILSHEGKVIGFISYLLVGDRLIFHTLHTDFSIDFLKFCFKNQVHGAAVFVLPEYRQKHILTVHLSQIIQEASQTGIRQVDFIEIRERWLLLKLSELLQTLGFNDISMPSYERGASLSGRK